MHPFVKIACFFFLLLLLPFLSGAYLALVCAFISLLAVSLNRRHFSRLIKRMRWLFISLLLVYGYATPGEYLALLPLDFSPSYEGLALGLTQIAKLLIAVAALSVLFASSPKTQLMVGLGALLAPLKILGLDVDRFTTRLLLTLHYVEQMAVSTRLKLDFSQLDRVALAVEETELALPLLIEQPAFKWADKALLGLMVMAVLILTLSKLTVLGGVIKAWQA